ncbi:MAG TPA: Ig-like domain-containing protein [Pirellulales bacterium]|nr:Ig-like domain-containing protein [Pirellulales bacterium]
MFVNALLDRIFKGIRRHFRQEYSRRPFYRRGRKRRRSFWRSLLVADAPLGTIAPRRHALVECLESRVLLTGNPLANNDTFVAPFNGQLTPSTPGVLANDSDPNQGATMYTVLVTGPADANYFHFNSDGSFAYKPNFGFFGTDSFTYYIHDSFGYTSNTATVSLPIEYSVNSSDDLTKAVAIDPLDTSVQILGSASGAPSTRRPRYGLAPRPTPLPRTVLACV